MKVDLTKGELKTLDLLLSIEAMKSQQHRLLSLAAELQTLIEDYQTHYENVRKFDKSIDKSWIKKNEEPSEFYLNEKEIEFKDGKII